MTNNTSSALRLIPRGTVRMQQEERLPSKSRRSAVDAIEKCRAAMRYEAAMLKRVALGLRIIGIAIGCILCGSNGFIKEVFGQYGQLHGVDAYLSGLCAAVTIWLIGIAVIGANLFLALLLDSVSNQITEQNKKLTKEVK